jgi:hypothetical protein
MKRYASLIGPLLGLYFPLPDAPEAVQRVMMNTSRLKNLWHSIYTEEQAKDGVEKFGGALLPDSQAKALDYSSFEVQKAQEECERRGGAS